MIKILTERIDKTELLQLCDEYFKTFVKIVADIEKGILAIGGELHTDAGALLIEAGSQQKDLWGANYYPYKKYEDRLEFTALINIRARDDNFGMEIQSGEIRDKIVKLTDALLLSFDDKL